MLLRCRAVEDVVHDSELLSLANIIQSLVLFVELYHHICHRPLYTHLCMYMKMFQVS